MRMSFCLLSFDQTFCGEKAENTVKAPPCISPSKYKPPGGLYLENCPQIQSKQSKNGKFSSNFKASPIDFET